MRADEPVPSLATAAFTLAANCASFSAFGFADAEITTTGLTRNVASTNARDLLATCRIKFSVSPLRQNTRDNNRGNERKTYQDCRIRKRIVESCPDLFYLREFECRSISRFAIDQHNVI